MAQSRPVRVQLPAQPMDRALEQLARQSGADILFTQDAVKGLRAPSLSGDFDAETAVRHLVQGTLPGRHPRQRRRADRAAPPP
jgi:iron complex outermembrane receptor protein